MEMIFHSRRWIVVLAILIGIAALAYFVWPTPYKYEEVAYARVPAEKWGLYSLAAFSFSLEDREDPLRDSLSAVFFPEEVREDRVPVYIRTRTSRLTGGKEYEIWVTKDDAVSSSPWFTLDTYTADSDWVYATRGISLANEGISFADNIFERRIKLVWPDSIKDEIESGNFGILKAQVQEQKWWAVPAGESITAIEGGESRVFDEDLVGLDLILKVENTHTSERVSVPDAFYVIGNDHVLLSRLIAKGNDALVIPPNTSKNLALTSVLIPHNELANAGRLHIMNVTNGWRWENYLPSMDVLRREYETDKMNQQDSRNETASTFEASIVEQKWVGLPAGTEVNAGGQRGELKNDVAGIEISLRITNSSNQSATFFPPLYLVGDQGIQLREFAIMQNEAPPSDIPVGGILFNPNEVKVLHLDSGLTGYDKLKAAGNYYISHPRYEWLLETEPMPIKEVLLGNE